MCSDKDKMTAQLRSAINLENRIRETGRAESGLTTLSFQSILMPERHVWIDTDLGGQIVLDLEDWDTNETWDNSVAHISVPTIEIAGMIVIAWLSGKTVDDCRRLGGQDVDLL